MESKRIGIAGSLESNDLLVTVNLDDMSSLEIELDSVVKEVFGKQILKTVTETLNELKIEQGYIKIVDRGALDFAIKARVKTAIKRAKGEV